MPFTLKPNKILYSIALSLAFLLSSGCDRGENPNLVGRRAPDFTVKDSDRSVSLHDLHGKVIVLNFWATWCPPCVQEMPSLVAMQAQLKDRVSVLAVNVDHDEGTYHRFLREYNINLLTVRDPLTTDDQQDVNATTLYGTTKLYRTDGYPETFIIDTNGVVRRKFVGPIEWTKPDIVEYLKQL